MTAENSTKPKESNRTWWIAGLFLVTFLVLLGFIVVVMLSGQLKEMMALSALAYGLASMGFLAVVAWAYIRGQFVDYESIKDEIFELEERR